jgi:tetratricopeptide (TPR) repeat protein
MILCNRNKFLTYVGVVFCIYLGSSLSFAQEELLNFSDTEKSSKEEVLSVRRILEFWKDHEVDLVLSQIENFLETYQDSDFKEGLLIIKGHALFEKQEYKESLNTYQKISSEENQEKVQANILQILFLLERYQDVVNITTKLLEDESQDTFILYIHAQSMFRIVTNLQGNQEKSFMEIIGYFEKLIKFENYRSKVLLNLAESYKAVENYQRSGELYQELITIYPQYTQKLNFQSAVCYSFIDKEKAIVIFEKIWKERGEESHQAAFKWLLLNYDLNNNDEVLSQVSTLRISIAQKDEANFFYYVGQIYFNEQEYDKSFEFMRKASSLDLEKNKELRSLFVAMMSAYQIQDDDSCQSLATQILKVNNSQNSSQFPFVLYLRALSLHRTGQSNQALKDLDRVLIKYPNFEKLEEVVFMKAEILHQTQQWQKSRDAFFFYISEYFQGSYYSSAYRYFLDSSLSSLEREKQNYDKEKIFAKREQSIVDLEKILEQKGVLLDEEKATFLLVLGRLYYEQNLYPQSLEAMGFFIKDNPKHKDLYQAYFLTSLCYLKQENQLEAFAFNAEQALILNPQMVEAVKLHYNLCNSYLKLCVDLYDSEKKRYQDFAALHLYEVLVLDDSLLDRQQVVWLANYLFLELSQDLPELPVVSSEEIKDKIDQAINAHKKVLQWEVEKINLEEFIFHSFEQQSYQMAYLIGMEGDWHRQRVFLEDLKLKYEEGAQEKWKYREITLLMLAQNYEILDASLYDAKSIYEEILESNVSQGLYVYQKAKLQLARLEYKLFMNDESKENNLPQEKILSILKEVQIYKDLRNEPVHLEAAIDYAEFYPYLMKQEHELDEKYLFLLQRAKEEFTRVDDIQSKDYNEQRSIYPEKNRIYQAYIMLMDAKIAFLKGNIAQKKNRHFEAMHYKEAAGTIFNALKQEDFLSFSYILEHVEKGLVALQSYE